MIPTCVFSNEQGNIELRSNENMTHWIRRLKSFRWKMFRHVFVHYRGFVFSLFGSEVTLVLDLIEDSWKRSIAIRQAW
jgi:hypothetical protein